MHLPTAPKAPGPGEVDGLPDETLPIRKALEGGQKLDRCCEDLFAVAGPCVKFEAQSFMEEVLTCYDLGPSARV